MKNELEKKVIKIIASVSEVSEKKIKMDSNLISDLELDSLDVVELITKFEDAFKLEIEDKDIKDFQTVGDVVHYIKAYVQDIS